MPVDKTVTEIEPDGQFWSLGRTVAGVSKKAKRLFRKALHHYGALGGALARALLFYGRGHPPQDAKR
jgi:hypothetical protein